MDRRHLTRFGGSQGDTIVFRIFILRLGEMSSDVDLGDDGMEDREVVKRCEEVSDRSSIVTYDGVSRHTQLQFQVV